MPIACIKQKEKLMEIRTFTNFWNMEKKLYAIYDLSLPVPISLRVVGAFLLTGLPWWGLMALLHIPFGSFIVFWVLPPILLGYMASKPMFQKKTLMEFLISQATYFTQPKKLGGLREIDNSYGSYKIATKIFKRNSKDN